VRERLRHRRSRIPLALMFFDVLELRGRDLRGEPYRKRRAILEQIDFGGKVRAGRAEDARNAAERSAEKERSARINAEEERDERLASLRATSQEKSRVDRVIEQHGVTA
jgi:ATP-dependent DNA ligase